jgi:hypothetical protein
MPFVSVKTISNKSCQIDFDGESINVDELMNIISKTDTFDNPPIETQKLICLGKILKTSDTVQSNSSIVLMISKPKNTSSGPINTPINTSEPIDTPVNTSEPIDTPTSTSESTIPNPFNTAPEMIVDEQMVASLTMTQHLLIKTNPQLAQMIDPQDNLMEQIIRTATETNSIAPGFEQLESNPQVAIFVIINYLKTIKAGQDQFELLKPICVRLTKRMEESGPTGLIISKSKMEEIQSKPPDFENMTNEQIQSYKSLILENQPDMFEMLATMSDADFKLMMSSQVKAKEIKKKLDELEKENGQAFKQAIQMKIMEQTRNNVLELTDEDKTKIREISLNFGFNEEQVKRAFIDSGKNVDLAVNLLFDE